MRLGREACSVEVFGSEPNSSAALYPCLAMGRSRLRFYEVRSADLLYKVRGFTGSGRARGKMRGLAGKTRNGSADCESIAFRFPSMCIRAFKTEKPRTLYRRSATCLLRGHEFSINAAYFPIIGCHQAHGLASPRIANTSRLPCRIRIICKGSLWGSYTMM